MKRQSLNGYVIKDSLTGFINLTSFLRCASDIDRRVSDILSSRTVAERVYHLLLSKKIIEDSPHWVDSFLSDRTSFLKISGLYNTIGARYSKLVFVHPSVFQVIMYEYSPSFCFESMSWVSDNFIDIGVPAVFEPKYLNLPVSEKPQLYFIEMFNESDRFIKIGITKNFNRRRKDFLCDGYFVRIIKLIDYDTINDAIREESRLHLLFKDYCHVPFRQFGGWTECFNVDIMNRV